MNMYKTPMKAQSGVLLYLYHVCAESEMMAMDIISAFIKWNWEHPMEYDQIKCVEQDVAYIMGVYNQPFNDQNEFNLIVPVDMKYSLLIPGFRPIFDPENEFEHVWAASNTGTV